jgi:uncharacterized protein (DUF2236 family)
VAEHSSYRRDPWGRLFRTLDFTNSLIYTEPQVAAKVARNLRSIHTQIKGVRADGSRYHALEPGAYAWVHASLFGAIASAHARFGIPLQRAQQEQFWIEWRGLGRLLGVRERDLPVTLGGYEDYFEEMVLEVLEDNASVQGVIETLDEFTDLPMPRYAEPVWRLGSLPAAHALRLATVGMLPGILRDRFGLRWTHGQEVELRTLGWALRAATPLMPQSLRVLGPFYLRWRGDALPGSVEEAPG